MIRRTRGCARKFGANDNSKMQEPEEQSAAEFYCPNCARPVADPLVCGDCQAVICRVCGTPLERADELGIG
jgi:hypothetical protein